MDDYSIDRPELNGALFSVEFGTGGRIQQLWLGDPNHADAEEFQFVAPPITMGDEVTEDYFPGTILLAARTDPDEPWVSSRNQHAELLDDQNGFTWEYEFPFMEELVARGRFNEVSSPVPHLVWDVELRNRSRRSIEIGELGFPMAFNNVLEGYLRTDQSLHEMYQDRVHVHKFIGGAASYLFAQRMNARPPGLLVVPGENTSWEFTNNVPASLATPYRWDGIPIVYVHSLATIEREEWTEWFNGHSNRILEPGETANVQLKFLVAERDKNDHVSSALAMFGQPAIRLLPAAVAPMDVGIAVEIVGATPTQFDTDVEAETETDADEAGGFCFVRPTRPGPVMLSFEDTQGRMSKMHLLFTEPITDLMTKRANYILTKQIAKTGPLKHAILPADNLTGLPMTELETFVSAFGIESSFADAIFLAEKNRHIPESAEIKALDRHLKHFVEEFVVNPGDGSVGSIIPSLNGISAVFGRPQTYPMAVTLYLAMARLAELVPVTEKSPQEYLEQSAKIAFAMFRNANPGVTTGVGLPLMDEMMNLLTTLWRFEMHEETQILGQLLNRRSDEFMAKQYPFAGETLWNGDGFSEVYDVSRRRGNDELAERASRLAFASRSLSPSWWWYGSDKRWLEDLYGHPTVADKGEICHGLSSVANSQIALALLEHDASALPEAYMRAAFGGLLAPWALVRADGAGSLGFTPDMASAHYGMNRSTGELGIPLYQYMRSVASYVLPTVEEGMQTFGCHFEVEQVMNEFVYTIRPWDGIGHRIVVRHIGLEAKITFGRILDLRFGARKRKAGVRIQNPAKINMSTTLRISGLWGRRFKFGEQIIEAVNGELELTINLPKNGTVTVEVEVVP